MQWREKMKKNTCLFMLLFICGCSEYRTLNEYKLEKYKNSEVPVCVNYRHRMKLVKDNSRFVTVDACGEEHRVPDEYEEADSFCSTLEPEVVSYNHCLAELPKPVHLVEKKVGDITICYDRNNKVELPILYCQKDMINIQTVTTSTNVFQRTNVSQKTIIDF